MKNRSDYFHTWAYINRQRIRKCMSKIPGKSLKYCVGIVTNSNGSMYLWQSSEQMCKNITSSSVYPPEPSSPPSLPLFLSSQFIARSCFLCNFVYPICRFRFYFSNVWREGTIHRRWICMYVVNDVGNESTDSRKQNAFYHTPNSEEFFSRKCILTFTGC